MLNRRRVTACACACCLPLVARAQTLAGTRGCLLSADDVDRVYPVGTATRVFMTGHEPMIPHSGDRDFDRALAQSLARLSEVYGVLPAFAYFDDSKVGNNALATPLVRVGRADGTVLFGTGMLAEQRARKESPEVAVLSICAHEFGHIVQYKHGLDRILLAGSASGMRVELQADFFSGYFCGVRRKERPAFPSAVAALALYDLGDNSRGPDHHGTREQRGAAFVAGYTASNRDNRSMAEAIQLGTNHVMRF